MCYTPGESEYFPAAPSIISYMCYTPGEPDYFPAAPSLDICATPPENLSISPLGHH
jgi:hypothetical protein